MDTTDTRPLCLPAKEFDDSIEILDGAHDTLRAIEMQLCRHFSEEQPLDSGILGLVRVSRAALRVVLTTLCDAEALDPTND